MRTVFRVLATVEPRRLKARRAMGSIVTAVQICVVALAVVRLNDEVVRGIRW